MNRHNVDYEALRRMCVAFQHSIPSIKKHCLQQMLGVQSHSELQETLYELYYSM